MKNIELPRKVVVGEGAVEDVADVAEELGLRGTALIVCDENTRKVAGEDVARHLAGKLIEYTSTNQIRGDASAAEAVYLVAVGGGTVIDATKIASHEMGLLFLSIPTAASHDGIASPRATLNEGKPVSVHASCPIGVIADTGIISNAPPRLLSSGCADAISNYTAVLDWRLAHEEAGEYYGDYAAALSMLSAEIVMKNAGKIKEDVSILVEALISSGVAIGIAGSSSPCSGAEHAFSHVLDVICEKPALHGEQCGVGSILTARLHDADWEGIRDALAACGAPTTAKELGIPPDKIIEALTKAHTIRDRYTILRDGLIEKDAKNLAEETGVI